MRTTLPPQSSPDVCFVGNSYLPTRLPGTYVGTLNVNHLISETTLILFKSILLTMGHKQVQALVGYFQMQLSPLLSCLVCSHFSKIKSVFFPGLKSS